MRLAAKAADRERAAEKLRPSFERRLRALGYHGREIAHAYRVDDESDRPHSGDLSDTAITLRFRAVRRAQRAAATNANRSETPITIDGGAAPFVTLTTPSGRWVAARRHAGLTVTIAAHDVEPDRLVIEPLADPAERLLGPEPDAR